MAEQVGRKKMSVVGSATDSSLSMQQNRIESDAEDAKQPTKDDFLADLAALSGRKTTTALRCHIAIVLEELDVETAAKLVEALDNPQIRGSWISQLLQKYGYRVSAGTVQRHRRRSSHGDGCQCP